MFAHRSPTFEQERVAEAKRRKGGAAGARRAKRASGRVGTTAGQNQGINDREVEVGDRQVRHDGVPVGRKGLWHGTRRKGAGVGGACDGSGRAGAGMGCGGR